MSRIASELVFGAGRLYSGDVIDSHAHVLAEQFNDDRADVLVRAQERGVVGMIEVGTDVASSRAAVDFAGEHEKVWATVGVHPSDVATLSDTDWEVLHDVVSRPNVVAVGEVGFDFYRGGTRAKQQPALEKFVVQAVSAKLPIVFHVRDGEESAHDALIDFMTSVPADARPRGVIHTFSGNMAQAEQYLDLGLYISFSGVITFKNVGVLLDVARGVPLDKILVETDCPFLAPVPHRGQRNEPAYVRFVAEKLAELRGISREEIDRVTEANTRSLFKLK